jgi:hypothetical protein
MVEEVTRFSSSVEVARTLSEIREVLRQFETSALADVARTLSEVAESSAQTTREISAPRGDEWVDAEAARLHSQEDQEDLRF